MIKVESKISVLMSIFHKEKPEYLKQAIDSTLNQTLAPNQIVVVIDGPIPQKLWSVLKSYQKENLDLFKLVPLEKNQGLGVALAIGVENCMFDLIARMDTDDIMEPNRLKMQVDTFEKNPNLTILGSNIKEFIDGPDKVIGKRIVPASNEAIREFSKRRNPFNHMTVMFKRAAVLAVGNYQSMPGFEDYYLWVRLLKAGYQGMNLEDYLVYARAGADMYSRRGGWNYFIKGIKGRRQIYKAGLGSGLDFIVSTGAHAVISLMPNKIRGIFYEKKLRI